MLVLLAGKKVRYLPYLWSLSGLERATFVDVSCPRPRPHPRLRPRPIHTRPSLPYLTLPYLACLTPACPPYFPYLCLALAILPSACLDPDPSSSLPSIFPHHFLPALLHHLHTQPNSARFTSPCSRRLFLDSRFSLSSSHSPPYLIQTHSLPHPDSLFPSHLHSPTHTHPLPYIPSIHINIYLHIPLPPPTRIFPLRRHFLSTRLKPRSPLVHTPVSASLPWSNLHSTHICHMGHACSSSPAALDC